MSLRLLQLTLAAAAAAAVVVMFDLFSIEVRLGCLGLLAATAALTVGERRRRGGGWWTLLAAGALLSIAGLAIAEVADTPGGIVAIVGAALVITAATIGFPVDVE